jgi:hypothetical protein
VTHYKILLINFIILLGVNSNIFAQSTYEPPSEQEQGSPETKDSTAINDEIKSNENKIEDKTSDKNANIVDVHLPEEVNSDYNSRKSRWDYRVVLAYDQMLPDQFISLAPDAKTYTNLFGSASVSMPGAGFGMKLNTSLGGAYLDLIYGNGNVSVGTAILSLEKTGFNCGVILDSLFKNPWFSPFAGVQAVYFNWKEVDVNVDLSGKTAWTTGVVAGIAIHLNRIDKQTALEAYNDHGLKNTFLDIYGLQFNTSNSANDPELKTGLNLGVAFRLEF